MLVFVDESGDGGMKLGAGSSDLFILTAVLFQDRDEAQRCSERFPAIRAELGMSAAHEFHFNAETSKARKRFLERVAPFDFYYFGVVVEKARLNTPVRNPAFQFAGSVIKYAAGTLFESARPYLKNATVVLDAGGSREFRNQLLRYLKMRMRDRDGFTFLKKVRTARSRGENLLQLADMVSGALWQCFRHGNDACRCLVQGREAAVEVWPQ